MHDICLDNRFKLIEKYKKELIESTNIETSQDEMAVLDNLLFRFWQMGWFDRLEQPERKTGEWILCSEMLPEANGRYLVTRGLNACGSLWNRVYIVNYSDLMGLKKEKIWWDGNVGKSDFERIDDVIAWMPLPEPYKEGEA